MSEENWTDEPWVVLDEVLVWASCCDPIESMHDIRYPVAEVRARTNPIAGRCIDPAEVKANAHLIAAAPALYKELKAMSDVLGRVAVAAAQQDWSEVAAICFAETGVDFCQDGSPSAKTTSLAKARGEL